MNTKSFYRVAAIVLALAVTGLLLARSLSPRMEGMGPTGSMPMPENAPNDTQGMDMEGMDHSGMDMNNQEQEATNP